MLPYRFRRQLPLGALAVAALGAVVVLLPSGDAAVTPASALDTRVEPAAETPSFIAALPQPTSAELAVASVAPAPQPSTGQAGAVASTGRATLTVTPTPLAPTAANASAIDAQAAEAAMDPPEGKPVQVGDSAVNVRAGPTTSARKLFVLQPGERVSAAEIEDGWVRIVRGDGEGGWVYSRYINGIGEPAEKEVEVSSSSEVRAAEPMPERDEVRRISGQSIRLNGSVTVRAGPSRLANRLFVLRRGERIQLAEVENGWARVVLPSGVSGWIPVR